MVGDVVEKGTTGGINFVGAPRRFWNHVVRIQVDGD